jgi:hypothetical protein
MTPVPNRFGSTIITVQVRDPGGLMASDVFTLTVRSINDPPTLSNIADQSMPEDSTLAIPFVIGDVESPPDTLTIGVIVSNTNLLAATNMLVTGTGTNRLLTLRPSMNQTGSVTVTVTVTDTNLATTTDDFVLTVVPVNDPPTLDGPGDLTIAEDAGLQVVLLTGIGSGASNELQSLTITATSSDPSLIPDPIVAYTNGQTTGSLTFTPLPNASGTSTITVRVDDGGASNNVITRPFTVRVNSVNDLPGISLIPDLSMDDNTTSPPISFSVTDVETPAAELAVVATASNTNLFPLVGGPPGQQAGLLLDGTGTNRTLTLVPATNQSGVALITLTVTDNNSGASNRSFQVTVRQTAIAPTITGQPESQTVTNGATAVFSVTANGTAPMFFQWQRNGADLPGQTNATLTITGAQGSDAGSYLVVVRNRAGSVTSAPAALRVLVSPSITSIALVGVAAQISFTSRAGLSYTVEFTDSPEAPGWNPLPTVVGTGAIMTVTDSAATASSRIYRIRVE